MEKQTIRCPYCGSETQKILWVIKLQLIFKDKITHHCRICHYKSIWVNPFYLVHDSTNKSEKEFNKQKLWDTRL